MLENLINRMCSLVLFFILVGACQQGAPTERHSASSNVKGSSDSAGANLAGSAPSGLYSVDNGCDAMIVSAASCTKSTNLHLTQTQSGTAQQTRNANDPVSLTPEAGLQLVSESDTTTQDTTTVSTTAITTTTAASSIPTPTSSKEVCIIDIEKQGICEPEPRTQLPISNVTTDVPYYFALPGSVVHNATMKCESMISAGHVCKTYTTYSAFDGKSFTATTIIAACNGRSCVANSANDMCSGCLVDSKYSPISLDTVFTYLGSGQSGGTQGVDAQSTDTQSNQ